MKPIKKNVLVKLDSRKEVSEGGIVIPERSMRAEEWGEVVGVGSECVDISVGDRVYVSPTQGTHYIKDGDDMIVILETKVLAIECVSR